MKEKQLVTGGLGYTGSHIPVELSAQAFDVVIVGNFSKTDGKEPLYMH